MYGDFCLFYLRLLDPIQSIQKHTHTHRLHTRFTSNFTHASHPISELGAESTNRQIFFAYRMNECDEWLEFRESIELLLDAAAVCFYFGHHF